VDHVGGAKRILDARPLEVLAGGGDVVAVESGKPVASAGALTGAVVKGGGFDGVKVDRPLREGDEIAGFRVLDVPGHSPGHVAFWRESDRTLICGDVFFGMNVFTTVPGLRWPLGLPTVDPALNRESGRKLAALEPETVLFGHGPPLTGAAPKLKAFVAKN
jgi:glyoxylase-like metal-dependent hydrolase (beta-lactamase superfamily II)